MSEHAPYQEHPTPPTATDTSGTYTTEHPATGEKIIVKVSDRTEINPAQWKQRYLALRDLNDPRINPTKGLKPHPDYPGHNVGIYPYLENLTTIASAAEGMDTETGFRIYTDIADALATMHQSNITHGNLEPHNIALINSKPLILDTGFIWSKNTNGDPIEPAALTDLGALRRLATVLPLAEPIRTAIHAAPLTLDANAQREVAEKAHTAMLDADLAPAPATGASAPLPPLPPFPAPVAPLPPLPPAPVEKAKPAVEQHDEQPTQDVPVTPSAPVPAPVQMPVEPAAADIPNELPELPDLPEEPAVEAEPERIEEPIIEAPEPATAVVEPAPELPDLPEELPELPELSAEPAAPVEAAQDAPAGKPDLSDELLSPAPSEVEPVQEQDTAAPVVEAAPAAPAPAEPQAPVTADAQVPVEPAPAPARTKRLSRRAPRKAKGKAEPALVAAPKPAAPTGKRPTKKRAVIFTSAALVALLAGGLGVAALTGNDDAPAVAATSAVSVDASKRLPVVAGFNSDPAWSISREADTKILASDAGIAVYSDKKITIYDLEGKKVRETTSDKAITGATTTRASGKAAFVWVTEDKTVHLWHPELGADKPLIETSMGDKGNIYTSGEQVLILSGDEAKTLTDKEAVKLPIPATLTPMAVDGENHLVSGGFDQPIEVSDKDGNLVSSALLEQVDNQQQLTWVSVGHGLTATVWVDDLNAIPQDDKANSGDYDNVPVTLAVHRIETGELTATLKTTWGQVRNESWLSGQGDRLAGMSRLVVNADGTENMVLPENMKVTKLKSNIVIGTKADDAGTTYAFYGEDAGYQLTQPLLAVVKGKAIMQSGSRIVAYQSPLS